jgi:Swt1-like HEPN/NPCBM/NEW2 domain
VELSNRDWVGRGFELLAEGLEPFVERHMASVAPGGMDWLSWESSRGRNRGKTLSKTDPYVLLSAIVKHEEAFGPALTRAERSYAQELWECRNNWAHNSIFNEADTHRLLDTIERLLRGVGAAIEADEVQRLLRDYKASRVAGSSHASGTHLMPRLAGLRSILGGNITMAISLLAVIFVVLTTIGLVLLPSATIAEKALIVAACFAVPIAGLAGFAARRSMHWFALTAIAGGLAIVCLAGLSVVAGDSTRGQQAAMAGRGLSPSSQADHTQGGPASKVSPATPPSPSQTASPGQAGSNSPQYLAGLNGDSGDTDTPQDGSWIMQGKTYAHSIGYAQLGQEVSLTYELKRSYNYFIATIGINDNADPMDQNTSVEFIVYGNPNGGSIVSLSDETVQWGKPALIDVNVRGATTLRLVTSSYEGLVSVSSVAVWGNARLAAAA